MFELLAQRLSVQLRQNSILLRLSMPDGRRQLINWLPDGSISALQRAYLKGIQKDPDLLIWMAYYHLTALCIGILPSAPVG